jgi:chaperonin GroEL
VHSGSGQGQSARGDEKIGFDILCGALKSPTRQIVDNGGHGDGLSKMLEKGDSIGFDANTGEFVDMFKAGIIDPPRSPALLLQRRFGRRPDAHDQ